VVTKDEALVSNNHPNGSNGAVQHPPAQQGPPIAVGVNLLPGGVRLVAIKAVAPHIDLSPDQARFLALSILDAATLASTPPEALRKIALAGESGLVLGAMGLPVGNG